MVFSPIKISHEPDKVADCLVNFDRSGDSTACWLNQPRTCVVELVAADCNPVTLE